MHATVVGTFCKIQLYSECVPLKPLKLGQLDI